MESISLTKGIILYDRSRVTTDWNCGKKRYWGYEYEGKGVSADALALELFLGTTFHDAAAVIATLQMRGEKIDIDLIADTAQQQVYQTLMGAWDGIDQPKWIEFCWEQGALLEGLIRAFYRDVWPALMTDYKVVAVEKEFVYRHNENGLPDPDGMFQFMVKPDLLLEDHDGNVVYFEYKTTSSKKDQWVNSWNTAIQLHSTCRAVAQAGINIVGVVVQGVYKGYESYGKQSSPFCYGYARSANPPFVAGQVRYDYAAGFKRAPVWQMEGGVKKWVSDMPSELIGEQFPRTPVIFPKDDLVDKFFKQRAYREFEINKMGTIAPDIVFQQNFAECTPAWGKPCSFRRLCHGQPDVNPLEKGYTWRVPHHDPEVEAWNDTTRSVSQSSGEAVPDQSQQ